MIFFHLVNSGGLKYFFSVRHFFKFLFQELTTISSPQKGLNSPFFLTFCAVSLIIHVVVWCYGTSAQGSSLSGFIFLLFCCCLLLVLLSFPGICISA
nr:MAG TPA: hypothetical protein [Caudoviricetes sp.]